MPSNLALNIELKWREHDILSVQYEANDRKTPCRPVFLLFIKVLSG